jgi:hypothetical protein
MEKQVCQELSETSVELESRGDGRIRPYANYAVAGGFVAL